MEWKSLCRRRFCVDMWLLHTVEDLCGRMVTVEGVSDGVLTLLMEGTAVGLDRDVLEEVLWQAVVQEHT